MMGWIEDIVARGIRRPGYEADTWTEGFVVDRLREMGLDVRTEPVTVTRWEPLRWSLTVTPEGATPFELDCLPLPYAAPTAGIELDLVRHDPEAPTAAAGHAALVDARLVRLPADAVAGFGSVPDDLAGRIYDPDGTLTGQEHVLPHTAQRNRIADPVFQAGAAAFIGTLLDHPTDSHRYFVPYHGEPLPGPGVWISGTDGEHLHDLLARGPVRVRLEVESTSEPFESHTVIADLPGADDDVVLVGSHHDGPWASAVEDGTGIALVLAQAAHWAAVPRERRPHHLRFVLHAGHMCGGAGHDAYVRDHADELDRIVLAVHLEHAALDTVEERTAPWCRGRASHAGSSPAASPSWRPPWPTRHRGRGPAPIDARWPPTRSAPTRPPTPPTSTSRRPHRPAADRALVPVRRRRHHRQGRPPSARTDQRGHHRDHRQHGRNDRCPDARRPSPTTRVRFALALTPARCTTALSMIYNRPFEQRH